MPLWEVIPCVQLAPTAARAMVPAPQKFPWVRIYHGPKVHTWPTSGGALVGRTAALQGTCASKADVYHTTAGPHLQYTGRIGSRQQPAGGPWGRVCAWGEKGTKKKAALKSLSHLRFWHADRCRPGLVACKNLRWDKDFKVVSFLVPFLPRRRVSPTGAGGVSWGCPGGVKRSCGSIYNQSNL